MYHLDEVTPEPTCGICNNQLNGEDAEVVVSEYGALVVLTKVHKTCRLSLSGDQLNMFAKNKMLDSILSSVDDDEYHDC
jgi:hypothetical protein